MLRRWRQAYTVIVGPRVNRAWLKALGNCSPSSTSSVSEGLSSCWPGWLRDSRRRTGATPTVRAGWKILRRVAFGDREGSGIPATGGRRRVLQAAAILVVALGIGVHQPTRTATVRVLPAPLGNRSGATARGCELAIAVSSLYEPRKMRGAIAALAWRVPVRYRPRRPRATRLTLRVTRKLLAGSR